MIRLCCVLMLAFPAIALAQGTGIAWSKDLPTAFAAGKKQQKIIMICVNAKYVDGKKTEERANKGLREIVYKDARVVAASSRFVCGLVTPASGSNEIGELRLLGIEGDLVAPQHIFVHPDGKRILLRKQYWSHGKGEKAVQALLELMNKAHEALDADAEAPEPAEATPKDGPPAEGPKRAAWIGERMGEVRTGSSKERKASISVLVLSDKDGDCTTPLIALLESEKKNIELLIDVIRGLGRDKLFAAAMPLVPFLSHKDESVRANTAVSLEYIGDRESKVISALKKAAGKEKDEAIANHMFRALGRCGFEDKGARSYLLKKAGSAKTEFATFGPAIGLSYFEGDKKAARGMEKLIKKVGVPGGKRGGAQSTVKRGVFCWTLAEIGDPKSGKFMREEMLAKLENVQAFWVGGLKSFYANVARACEGDAEAQGRIAGGVRGFVGFAKGFDPDRYEKEARTMMDGYRKGREDGGFTPKGDYLLGGG